MKKYLFFKILIIASCLFFLTDCKSEQEQGKPYAEFVSVRQLDWGVVNKNFYSIQKSMRKIDSLSAALNLIFTRKNARGL